MKLKKIIQIMDTLYPPKLAESWDNPGLQVGDRNADIKKILLALSISDEVIEEAIEKGANLIITHHPFLFHGTKSIDKGCFPGNMIYRMIEHQISLFSAHTNFDMGQNGLNDYLASLLPLKKSSILSVAGSETLYKIVVFVPKGYEEKVKKALFENGAGQIGAYSNTSFSAEGLGSFLPGENTAPFLGKPGHLEVVEEVRIETVVPASKQKQALDAMIKAHPYEEVAYDVYALENTYAPYGLGKVGTLERDMTLRELGEQVKTIFGIEVLPVIGDLDTVIHKIAFCGGDGMSLLKTAKAKGADVILTGDIKYQNGLDALRAGMCLIDIYHFHSEQIALRHLKHVLEENGVEIELLISEKEKNPIQHV